MNLFVIGQVYRRRDLHARYGGQGQGGISTPAAHPIIFLFTGEQGTLYGYHDGFQDDGSFWYTGEGQLGNMQMVRGNFAIRNHKAAGKELHLFEYVKSSPHVRYIGRATYTGHHYALAPDRSGTLRQVIVFELALEADEKGMPDSRVDRPSREFLALWRRPLSDLREAAFQAANRESDRKAREVTTHYRSEVVRAYVLRRAAGKCEGCGNPAPFFTLDGRPYLEPHHIRRRADAGPDHPAWVIALCPTCHRRVHYGSDGGEYNLFLASHIAEIEPHR